MPTWMKVLLVAGVLLVVLIVGTVVAGYFAVRRYGPGLVEAGKQTYGEGVEYGRRTDNEGCLNEAVARQARADGFTDMIKNNVFMRACLEASRPTPGFCDDVPRQTEFMKAISWQTRQCQHYGLSPEKQCTQLFQQVQQFCELRRARAGNVNGSGNDISPPPPPAPPPSGAR
ncbi:MAG: hypothetical protein QOH49_881 [Acidobacteriota bacterium]|jgi:hypothetical protein|nr:hypothetical protein [Acidobacteriota bacterium]